MADPETFDVKAMYLELEQETMNRSAKGEKAEKIRAFIRDVGKTVKKNKLSLAALYKLAKKQFPNDKIDRSYFASIVEKTWATTKDETNGAIWVDITQEKQKPEVKAA